MKFGVIPPYARAPIEEGDYAIAFAQMAEACGFESVWVVEHVVMAVEYTSVYPYDPSGRSPFHADVVQPDPLLWLSYIAAATKRIRLGTSVLVLPQRNPVILAKALATLDRLSGGRVELGIGIGWVREEAEAVGTDFDNRGRRADEYIRVMRTLWREPVASFAGKFVRFDNVVSRPKPVQPGGVPIVIQPRSRSPAAARPIWRPRKPMPASGLPARWCRHPKVPSTTCAAGASNSAMMSSGGCEHVRGSSSRRKQKDCA
jgi:probable F420-dependent oxidoreductase